MYRNPIIEPSKIFDVVFKMQNKKLVIAVASNMRKQE